MFGGHVSLVPLRHGEWDGAARQLSGAPHRDPDTGISVRDEQELYRHYQVDDT